MKRAFAFILAAALLTGGIAGCGDKAEKSSAESSAAVSEVPESVKAQTTFAGIPNDEMINISCAFLL